LQQFQNSFRPRFPEFIQKHTDWETFRAKKLKGYTIEHLAGQFKEIFRNKLTKHLDLIIRRDCMKKQGEKLENDNWVNDIIHSKIGGY
jgi:hypothetical protein